MGEKVRFTVFLNTAVAIKRYLLKKKNRKFMKNSGLFLNMAKRCFLFVFSGFSAIVVCFCVSGKVASVKMLVSSQLFGALWGGLFLVIWVWKV